MVIDWAKAARDAVELVLVGGFSMVSVEATLGETTGRKKRYQKWLVVIVFVEVLLFTLSAGMDALDHYISRAIPDVWSRVTAATAAVTLTFILYNTVMMLLCTLIPFLGGMWIYRQAKSVRAFTAVLLGLGVSVLYEYSYDVLQLPFLGADLGTTYRGTAPLWISAILLFICLLSGWLLYKNKFLAPLKKIMDTPDGRMDSFVKVPVLSCIVFALLLATLRTFGITVYSVYWQDVMRFIVVFACLVFVYIMMYWAIFRGVTLSTEAMKNRAELDVAKHIQASVLPSTFPAFPERREFTIYASMEPAREVGGDFYDFFFVDENHLALVIADVSGKGIPAALFMMTARTLLKNLATAGMPPEKVLEEANERLCENNTAAMFVTAWMGILEIGSGRLLFANAGHNPPLLKHDGGEYQYLSHKIYYRSIMLGMRRRISYRCNEITLKTGDVLFLYTDGVTEACNKQLALFGEKRLKDSLDLPDTADPEELVHTVKSRLDAFADGADQFDDITMLALRIDALPQVYETAVNAEQIAAVSAFVEQLLRKSGCATKVIHQALIAVDEIFSNIVRYSGANKAAIRCLVTEREVTLSFEDNGRAYNPLEAQEPDIHAPKEKRGIGGLGVFVVKKSMDAVSYAYQDGKNILTVTKQFMENKSQIM